MANDDRKYMMDGFAWFLNVTTSVLIVFVNKKLMDGRIGHRFVFATTLCAFHFLSCAGSIWMAQMFGIAQRAKLPWGETLYFAAVANVSIASLNISLLVNTVGFYQIAKLLIIPFVCLVELFWLKRTFTAPVVLSVVTVVLGVGVVTITDAQVKTLGLVVAALSVVSSGMQQILCGTIQRKYKLSSHQLLSNTAPVQGLMLLCVGPFLDLWISEQWVLDYDMNLPALWCLIASCAIAVLVNISQFMCLGRFSAVSFQVLGHAKTISVLLIGWLYFHESMTSRKLLGMALAVLGMVMYGFFSSQQKPSSKKEEEAPLMGKEGQGEHMNRAEMGELRAPAQGKGMA